MTLRSLSTLQLFQLATVGLIIYEASWIIYCRFFHPLRSIPRPFLASVSRIWIVYHTATGRMEHTQRALHKRYGYMVRIAPDEVACSDPQAIKVIYSTKRDYAKSEFYDIRAAPNEVRYAGHFATRDEKVHSERRRIVNQAYSMSSILESEPEIDDCTRVFIEATRTFAQQKTVVDLGPWLTKYAFDVLGELFYGRMFGMMRENRDLHDIGRAVDAMLPAFAVGGTLPSYLQQAFLISTYLLSNSLRDAVTASKMVETVSIQAVEQRIRELKDKDNQLNRKHDMLRKMLEISDGPRGPALNFTHKHIHVESHISLFARADTTSIAMLSTLYYLMRDPRVYAKLQQEIDSAFASGRISDPVSYQEATTQLPYFRACVEEAMRLHPGVGLTAPRIVPRGGVTLASDVYIPAGYRVGVNAAVVQYDRDVFGPDADQYNPDRWLDRDPVPMERAMFVFGHGARTCIGKNIALCEIYKLLPVLLWKFQVRLVESEKEWTTKNFWFNKPVGVKVLFEERRGLSSLP
ncbi:cytochrome P450 [Aspergillus aculeatinus CBS 121060]|uniref:Cytochrome P450 oxidoreductase n=1 Tax=Aspergillus aculeatinus CBS 121060 TaxID=1448322 RepID=A0ACD1H8X0_9EURO|nr:cytochrome P450 oxidoreductase [Aspergillus aculeatinus CBS 121060]RAH70080.1 cytochrome P450 oxidoreductase [Aspergillus aculeatinus CBS 121060]